MLYVLYLLTVVVLVTTDQFSKYLIVRNVAENTSVVLVKNFFNITNVKNYGAGFSILQNQRFFLIAVTLIAVVIVIYLLVKSKNSEAFNRICYLLIIGGAIGNLIDRISLGYVVDFLDFYIFGYNFPVFNVADSFITIGCILLILSLLLENKSGKNKSNS